MISSHLFVDTDQVLNVSDNLNWFDKECNLLWPDPRSMGGGSTTTFDPLLQVMHDHFGFNFS